MKPNVDNEILDVEVGAIGAILGDHDPEMAKANLGEYLRAGVNEKWFAPGNNQRIWECLEKVYREKGIVDPSLVASEYGMGGAALVADFVDRGGVSSHAKYYLDGLTEREVYRSYHRFLMKSLQELDIHNARIAVFDAAKTIAELQTAAQGGNETLHGISEYVDEIVEEKRWLSEERFVKKNWGKYRGVPLPWSQLNVIYKGLDTGLHIVAALPSQGKTTFAANVSYYWIKRGIKHGFVCIDMPGNALAERYAAIGGQLSISKLDFGASPAYVDEFENEFRRLAKNDVVKITESDTVTQLEYEITRGVKTMGWKAVIVDYLQLIDPEMKSANAPYVLVKEATVQMKKLAKKLRIPIVALVQLSNQFAKDHETGTKKPRLDHLGDSSEIGRAARTVAVLVQDEDVVKFWQKNPPYQLAYGDPQGRLNGYAIGGEKFADMQGQKSIAEEQGAIRPIWFFVIKNQQGGRGDVPFLMFAKYFLMRPGDTGGADVIVGCDGNEVEEGVLDKKAHKVHVGAFARICDDWMFNDGDQILERTGGIGCRWVQFPGETKQQYVARVVRERAAHNSNSGMWDARLTLGDGSGVRTGQVEYQGEVKMVVEPWKEESRGED